MDWYERYDIRSNFIRKCLKTADICWEARDGSLVRALTSHQCGLSSIPDFDTLHIVWVEFVIGSLLCFKMFFLTTLAFPFPQKPMFDFQTPIQPGMVVGEPQCGCATSKLFFLSLFNSITIHNDNVLLWLLVCDIRHSLTVNLGCKLMPNHTYVTLYSIRRGKHFN